MHTCPVPWGYTIKHQTRKPLFFPLTKQVFLATKMGLPLVNACESAQKHNKTQHFWSLPNAWCHWELLERPLSKVRFFYFRVVVKTHVEPKPPASTVSRECPVSAKCLTRWAVRLKLHESGFPDFPVRVGFEILLHKKTQVTMTNESKPGSQRAWTLMPRAHHLQSGLREIPFA